jgi:predicted nucleic acid-binding protein
MSTYFLDTGYLIALEASDDQHHSAAQIHWRQVLEQRPRLVTTTYVFDEVVTFFNSRGRHAKAVDIGQRLRESSSVSLIAVDASLFEASWAFFQERGDKRYSLTDCISFVVMRRDGIQEALGFDRHFEQEGFTLLPG